MSRPSKYSADIADKIVTRLRAGNTLRASARSVGISEDTLLAWRHRYSAFSALIDQAEAEAEVMYAATVAKAAREGDWRAAITWLERRRHDDWRERKETQLTGKDGEPLGDTLSDEARAKRIAGILDRIRSRATGPAESGPPDMGPDGGTAD